MNPGHACLLGLTLLLPTLIGLRCAASDDAAPQPRALTAPDRESEVDSPVQHPVSLALLSTHDVTPAGKRAYRPDVVAVNGELWLAYNVADEGFALQRFDRELVPVGDPVPLYSGAENPTDVRVGRASERFWYALETAPAQPPDTCDNHFLNAAIYDGAAQLVASAAHIATGCPTTIEFMTNPPSELPPDPEVVDDPTPFYHGAKRYVLTRAWPLHGSTTQHVRILDDALAVQDAYLLDTGEVVPGRQLTQNALVHIRGVPHLVGGFSDGPPMPPHVSALYVIPLGDDMRSFAGPAVELATPEARFPVRVTRGRHVNGTLIINYIDQYDGSPTREVLALFDTDGFRPLGQEQVQDRTVVDNHSSFEVLGDRLYLFQQQEGERVSAKVFRLAAQ